jgi:hypothetical protein
MLINKDGIELGFIGLIIRVLSSKMVIELNKLRVEIW